MTHKLVHNFYFEDAIQNRKKLFSKALSCAKKGKVLYILSEELTELPELSQDFNQIDRHYMKMISFLYASTLQSLIESVATLPEWQNIPSTIMLDNLSAYCSKDNFQTACGITALLIDTARSCSKLLTSNCCFYLAATNDAFTRDNLKTLRELYITNEDDYDVM